MSNKPLLIFTGLAVVIIGLLIFARTYKEENTDVTYWNNTDVACIPGHENLALHIHPTLAITVDGAPETVPGNIGISNTCMAEAHTHDATGKIHFESIAAGREFTLADFYAVWGETIEREGYTHTVTLNGEPLTDLATALNDHDAVVISYTSVATSTEETL